MSLQCDRCLETNEHRREKVEGRKKVLGHQKNSQHFILGRDPFHPSPESLNLMLFLSCVRRGASERVWYREREVARKQLASVSI